jgi:RHS repeat-associated protein
VRQLPNGQMVMGRRIYDPSIGRFTTKDPIGFRGGDINLYRYCHNAPLINNDPTGLFAIEAIAQQAALHFSRITPYVMSVAQRAGPQILGAAQSAGRHVHRVGVDTKYILDYGVTEGHTLYGAVEVAWANRGNSEPVPQEPPYLYQPRPGPTPDD